LLAKNGISMQDVDLFEVNEAFASMMVYCVEKLNLPMDRLNVNGGAMCVNGHSGMSVNLNHQCFRFVTVPLDILLAAQVRDK
jgi:3-oxoacyl-[acyl-carrier-protein] synthase III